ncbi:hypothetical protein GCM10023086_22210 [Streptomyces venetus]|uniref:Uncharacterized protein n=1 Tax=Streptomyces venetus TaxID=1701086 RepID=A0ABP8FIT9_9ACTN
MQQHERPSGRLQAGAYPLRCPHPRLALATAADSTHAPRADLYGDGRADQAGLPAGSFENDGDGAGHHLPCNGAKISATGSRTVFLSPSGVSVSPSAPDDSASASASRR